MINLFFRISSALIIVLTFFSFLAPMVNPTWFRGLVFLGTAFPWLLMLNLAMFLYWSWKLNHYALYHAGMIALCWQYVTGFVGLDFGKDPVPETAITLATHNLGRMWPASGSSGRYKNLSEEYGAFWRRNGVPDILCTQETRAGFYRELAGELGYTHTFNLKKGTVILSKYPIAGGGEIPFTSTKNSSLWVDIRVGKRLLRVYNVHLQSNKVTNDAERMINEVESGQEQSWEEFQKVLHKVGGATRLRAEQARQLRAHIDSCKHRVVVCGDFNDTPNSYVYRTVSSGLTDTFREKGLGIGTTFAGVLPFLRIDYVLTSPRVVTYSCRILHGKYSDHYPVVTAIGI